MPSIEHLQSLTLDLPPCCVEFWPLNPQYAVLGTYNLENSDAEGNNPGEPEDTKIREGTKSQQRNGSLILVEIIDNKVKIIETLSTPSAILDIHFNTAAQNQTMFGVATSTGSIGIYHLTESHVNGAPGIIYEQTLQYFPEEVLVTAFSWHPNGSSFGMTLTTGEVCLRPFGSSKRLDAPRSSGVAMHDLEAWTLAFSADGMGVYSGGDDSTLKFTELTENHEHLSEGTVEAEDGALRNFTWSDGRIHGAGVTAILPLQSNDEGNFLLTGSYDDHIRLIYVSSVGRRTVLAELNLGGGVWRLKRLDESPSSSPTAQFPDSMLFLASCMYAGARILTLRKNEKNEWQFGVVAEFDEHKSMNYGSDCQPSTNDQGQRTIITTSFYDRLVCLWRY